MRRSAHDQDESPQTPYSKTTRIKTLALLVVFVALVALKPNTPKQKGLRPCRNLHVFRIGFASNPILQNKKDTICF